MNSKTQDSKGILWTISLVSFVFLLAISFLFVQKVESVGKGPQYSNVLVVKEGQTAEAIVDLIKSLNSGQLSEIKTTLPMEGTAILKESLDISKERMNGLKLPTTITFLSKVKEIELGEYRDNDFDQMEIGKSGNSRPSMTQASFGPWRLLAFVVFGLLSVITLGASIARYLRDYNAMVNSLKMYGSEESFIKKYLSTHLLSKLILGVLIGVVLYSAFVYLSNRYLGLSFLPLRLEYFIFIPILLIIVVYLTYKHSINKVITLS